MGHFIAPPHPTTIEGANAAKAPVRRAEIMLQVLA